ncbi:hypothetical protein EVG20_g9015 [Dentipellis fragilis]|uniref:REJ domain-containing protein n=1 Tax=Dentipellis fragilis TaxID=205917 RepID=A0A4Y9Y464_9AGAM|nr:hypothetical protein EVG20_g9015 [Dentipellis fragilis]
MRGTIPRAARVFTFFSLFVLCSLSFTLVFGDVVPDVNSPPAPAGLSFHKRGLYQHRRHFSHINVRADTTDGDGSSPTDTGLVSTPSDSSGGSISQGPSSTPPTSATKPTSQTSQSSSSADTHSTSSSPPQSTSDAAKTTSSSPATSSSDPGTSSTPSSQSSSSSSSSSAASKPASSSSSPSTSGPSQTVSSPTSTPASVTPATNSKPGGSTFNTPTQSAGVTHTVSAGPTDLANNSSKGFFHNSGAVAGTFVTIGVLALIVIVVVGTRFLRKRRAARRMSDEDDAAYFEPKFPVNHTYSDIGDSSHSRHDLGSGPLGASATSVAAAPATAEAYPDRAIHYGPSPDARADVYTPTDYGIAYPPGTTFAPQNEEPTPNHEDAYDPYSAYSPANHETAYHEPAHRVHKPSPLSESSTAAKHPFADPVNVRNQRAAPPVSYRGDSQYSPSVDSFYGTASGAGHAL